MFFFQIHNGRGKISPSKPLQKIPVGFQAHHTLNCLPKADELFIATELACESTPLRYGMVITTAGIRVKMAIRV